MDGVGRITEEQKMQSPSQLPSEPVGSPEFDEDRSVYPVVATGGVPTCKIVPAISRVDHASTATASHLRQLKFIAVYGILPPRPNYGQVLRFYLHVTLDPVARQPASGIVPITNSAKEVCVPNPEMRGYEIKSHEKLVSTRGDGASLREPIVAHAIRARPAARD